MIRRLLSSSFFAVFTTALLMIMDRATKLAAVHQCAVRTELWGNLWCTLEFNRGISWSFFHSDSTVVFSIVTGSIMALTLFVAYHGYVQYQKNKSVWPHALICMGSLSNIFDRIWYGGVIDFLGASYGGWDSPVINIADVYIVLGAFLLLMYTHE